mgnify:FL=1
MIIYIYKTVKNLDVKFSVKFFEFFRETLLIYFSLGLAQSSVLARRIISATSWPLLEKTDHSFLDFLFVSFAYRDYQSRFT